MTPLLVIGLAGLATYALRATPVALLTRRSVPAGLDRALRYAPPAILAGLVATAVANGGGLAGLIIPGPAMFAVLAGGVVAWRARNMLATVTVALAVFWLLSTVWS